MWRCSANPIIPRDLLPNSNSIFNSAVVPFKDGFAGVFRCDDTNRRMTLHAGFSSDGISMEHQRGDDPFRLRQRAR
jgi:beta-1,4-mannooligosaccharide/beta-1,4-mannosyl-N-acetylglucosamine phosphorylase